MSMSKKLILLNIVLIAAFTIDAESQQSTTAVNNKWEAEIKKFEEADRKNPPAEGRSCGAA